MNIRVDLKTNIADGSEVVFRSPADCSQVTGLVIYHTGGKTEFAFADAHGNNVGDIDHLFAENAVVKVILDVTAGMAFVQNADTNAYIERTFVKSVNGQSPDEAGNVEISIPEGGGGGNCPLTVETITIGEVGDVPVTGIELDYSTMSINEGESFQLAASVLPENATNNVVGWRSSDTSIATVTDGYVTGVSGGSVTITAYSLENNAITASCTVIVSAESGGGSTSDGKIMFSDLTPVNTGVMLKKDGKTEYAHSSCYGYYKIPYTEGMLVSTVFNNQYAGTYPPVMVIDNEIVTQPTTESVVIAGAVTNYTTKITGYSENAQVIVNITNIGVIGKDTNWNKCYYIAGGEE